MLSQFLSFRDAPWCLLFCSFSKTLAVYPSNTQFQAHFAEFTKNGYSSGFESCQVKFVVRDGSRDVPAHGVGLVDGHTKILIMAGIICGVQELDLDISHPSLRKILHSFSAVRCSYVHFDNPSHHYLHSLRDFSKNVATSFFVSMFNKVCRLLVLIRVG